MITTCATHLKHLATAHVLIKKHVWLRIELFYRESQPIAIISKHRRLCLAMRMGFESTRFVWS